MYSDRRKRKTGFLVLPLAILLLAVLVVLCFGNSGNDITEEGAASIHEAVRRSSLQCYVVEGVYPPDLEYLENNYGLRLNTEDYYVVYDCFASNLPPTIRVIAREGRSGA